MAIQSSKEDQSEEIEALKNVKIFLTNKIKQNESVLKSVEIDMVNLNDKLQEEKRKNLELTEKLDSINVEREDYRENIKELNLRYKNVVRELFLFFLDNGSRSEG